MAIKRYCDICEKEIPDHLNVGSSQGTSKIKGTKENGYNDYKLIIEEIEDLCIECLISDLKRGVS